MFLATLSIKPYDFDLDFTPIGQAIDDSNLMEVQNLIAKKKSSVKDSAYNNQETPILNHAIITYANLIQRHDTKKIKNALDILQFLIDNDAPLNQESLHIAAQYGLSSIVLLLLDNGAPIDSYNRDQETPLFIATAYNQPEIVQILLDHGANIKLENRLGRTPYDITISHPNSRDDYILTIESDPYSDEIEITPKDRVEIKKIFDDYEKHRHMIEGLQKVRVAEKKYPEKSTANVCFKFQ